MKKIKLLSAIVVGLIGIFVLFFIGNVYVTFFTEFMDQFDHLYDDFIFGYYTQFVSLFFSLISFIGLIYIRKALRITIKNGFFNSKSSEYFINAGKIFLLAGVLGGLLDLALFFRSSGTTGFSFIGQNFLLIILAFTLYIIADIIKNGNELKIDNDLTI